MIKCVAKRNARECLVQCFYFSQIFIEVRRSYLIKRKIEQIALKNVKTTVCCITFNLFQVSQFEGRRSEIDSRRNDFGFTLETTSDSFAYRFDSNMITSSFV